MPYEANTSPGWQLGPNFYHATWPPHRQVDTLADHFPRSPSPPPRRCLRLRLSAFPRHLACRNHSSCRCPKHQGRRSRLPIALGKVSPSPLQLTPISDLQAAAFSPGISAKQLTDLMAAGIRPTLANLTLLGACPTLCAAHGALTLWLGSPAKHVQSPSMHGFRSTSPASPRTQHSQTSFARGGSPGRQFYILYA